MADDSHPQAAPDTAPSGAAATSRGPKIHLRDLPRQYAHLHRFGEAPAELAALVREFSGVWGAKVFYLAVITLAPLMLRLKSSLLGLDLSLATLIYAIYHGCGIYCWAQFRHLISRGSVLAYHDGVAFGAAIMRLSDSRPRRVFKSLSWVVGALIVLTIVIKSSLWLPWAVRPRHLLEDYPALANGIGAVLGVPRQEKSALETVELVRGNGQLFVTRGQQDGVVVGALFTILGEEIPGTEDFVQVGLVKVVDVFPSSARVELVDADPTVSFSGEDLRMALSPHDPMRKANRYAYGQVLSFDGSEAEVNLGAMHGVAGDGYLSVLGDAVADLDFEGTPLGRSEVATLKIVAVYQRFLRARPASGRKPLKVGDFVLYKGASAPTLRAPEFRAKSAKLLSYGRHQNLDASVVGMGPIVSALRFGHAEGQLDVVGSKSLPTSFGHVVNLGGDIDFAALRINTDRSGAGRVFEGLAVDPIYFIRDTFCLLGRPEEVAAASAILALSVAVETGDVLLVRAYAETGSNGFFDIVAKVRVTEHRPDDWVALEWVELYRRHAEPGPSPQAPVDGEALAYIEVRNARTREPIVGASATAYDGHGNKVATGLTDDKGVRWLRFTESRLAYARVDQRGFRGARVEPVRKNFEGRANVLVFQCFLEPAEHLGNIEMDGSRCVFLVDTSGSMDGTLSALKQELRTVIGGLHEDVWFNVVSFSDSAAAWMPDLVRATPENVAAGCAFVSSMEVGGGTSLSAAMNMCQAMSGVEVVYIASDGAFGHRDIQGAVESLEAMAKKGVRAVRVNTIHYGAEGSESLRSVDRSGAGKHVVR